MTARPAGATIAGAVAHLPATAGTDGTGPPAPLPRGRACYSRRAMARTVGSTNSRKFTRRPPSEAEQARRKEWGRVWGQRVRQAAEQWKREQGG